MIAALSIIILIVVAVLNRNKGEGLQDFDMRSRFYGLVAAYYWLIRPRVDKLYRRQVGRRLLRYVKLCYESTDYSALLSLIISRSLVLLTLTALLSSYIIAAPVQSVVKMMALVSPLLCAVLPFSNLKQQYDQTARAIVRALPGFVHQLAMLMRSGATLESSVKIIYARLGREDALYILLNRVQLARARGEGVGDAFRVMPELVKHRAVHHLSLLMSQVSKTGVYHFSDQLIELGDLLIRDRQSVVKTISEQLSTKLLVPMMISMMTIMLILVYPILSQL